MRALREKMKEAAKKDNRGLSLVEILCAIAIFSMIAAAIGTVIVLSSRTFRRGVTETSLQQEAQLVANRIGTIVQDACDADFNVDTKTLKLKTTDEHGIEKTYEISHSGKELVYSEEGGISGAKLADKIEDFTVTTTDFEKSNTVYLDMRVSDGNKVYNVQYAISARNQMTADISGATLSEPVGILYDPEIIMVPGETYKIPYTVTGKVTIGMDAVITSGTATLGAVGIDGVEVTIPTDTTDSVVQLQVFTKDVIEGTTTPKKTVSINIRIRRVNSISVTHNSDRSAVDPSKSGNSYEAQGCVYTFYARVSADNPEKQAGTTYDSGWKNPNYVYWSDKATLNGTPVNVTDYFNVVYSGDLNIPTAKYTIKQDLPSGLRLDVTAKSKHAAGENKASSSYAVVEGSDYIEARPAKINPPDEISLDPTETGSVKLLMKGGKLTDIECIPRGNTDSSTQAYFNPSDNCVYVKIGKDERGSGTTPSDPKEKFTFTVDVCDKNTGDKKATITVHVKRVDKINLDKVDNKDGSYTFTTRFNVDRGASLEEVENNSLYLINNKYNPFRVNRTPFTLGVVYTFQVQDDGKKIDLGYIISRATCATEPNEATNMWFGEFKPFNNDNGYIKFEGYPSSHSAAVTGEDTDDSHLTALPTLKIRKAGKKFEKITVTAIAFHALGAEKGKDYMSDAPGIFANRASYGVIQDEQVIYGDQKIKIPADFVVVEPGQGFDGYTKSNDDGIDNELVVPIKIVGDYVDTMTAEIIGNLSTGTRLSKCYVEKEGKQEFNNPYWSRTDVGVNTADTWWLGLVIGADEKSKDMKVVIHGSDNKELLRFDLRLRRVEQVELTVDDQRSISEWNKAEEKVTLKAYVSGENFDEQKVNGETCRWETSGHGQYKSPGTIKWTMEYKYEEKTLDKWTEYFQLEGEPNIEKVIDNKKYSNSITFTLKKALPNGAIIRATSLHAKGDETEGTTTKYYNKAGKEYDKKFAEIKIGTSYVDVNFRRGTDNSLGNYFANNSKYRQDHTQRNFFRYREVGGAWSTYHIMDDRSETTVKFDGDKSSLLFLAEKEYQIEVINVVFDANQKKIYWPHDESLLEPGKGWKEEGYTKGWTENDVTPEDEYMAKLYIPKTQVFFGENKDWNVSDHSITFGSYGRNNPIPLSTGKSIKVDLQTDHFHLGNKQSYYKAKVQKLENGSWVDSSPYEWYLQTDCPNYQIYNITNNAKGTYRIGVVIQDMPWNKIGGSLMEPTFTQFNHSTELYDWTTDRGVIYLQFNE